jgi:glucosylceramidase
MKTALIILVMMLSVCIGCQPSQQVEWVSTTQQTQWAIGTSTVEKADVAKADVVINSSKTEQTIEGFGGCFNEMGWDALSKLNASDKDQLIKMLFDQQEGCKFNLCRMPLGANDYSMNWYSYNETDGDFAMEQFSIDRDKQRLIPYIHEAQKLYPGLRIWASPWCPPSWMKVNKHYACYAAPMNDLQPSKAGREMVDQFIMDDAHLKAYALYFSKFIKAYRQEGIDIEAVHVQNEPNSCQVFPCCIWTPASLGRFIADYLGPQFQKEQLATKIWLGTIERPQIERVDSVINYPGAARYITGVGFQWAGKDAIPFVHKKYPDLKLMQTETECGDGSNDWAAVLHTWGLMKHYFENGANAYMYWNMALDETGLSYWGWKQNSMISINPSTKTYRLNPEFYLMKHLSAYVEQGAKKLVLDKENPDCLAFKNSNSVVVVYYNRVGAREVTFKIDNQQFVANLQADSFNTFKVKI